MNAFLFLKFTPVVPKNSKIQQKMKNTDIFSATSSGMPYIQRISKMDAATNYNIIRILQHLANFMTCLRYVYNFPN